MRPQEKSSRDHFTPASRANCAARSISANPPASPPYRLRYTPIPKGDSGSSDASPFSFNPATQAARTGATSWPGMSRLISASRNLRRALSASLIGSLNSTGSAFAGKSTACFPRPTSLPSQSRNTQSSSPIKRGIAQRPRVRHKTGVIPRAAALRQQHASPLLRTGCINDYFAHFQRAGHGVTPSAQPNFPQPQRTMNLAVVLAPMPFPARTRWSIGHQLLLAVPG